MAISLNNTNILVIGDIMLDKYYFGSVKRISPEAPVPVVNVNREQTTLGGASNVANNIISLGGTSVLCGAVGNDSHGEELKRLCKEKNIATHFTETKFPTITKTRIIGERQQIVRLDFEEKINLDERDMQKYADTLMPLIDKSDIVVISDYAKGFISPNLCKTIIEYCNNNGTKIIIDPKGKDWDKYKEAWLITPNVKELGDISGREVDNTNEDISEAAEYIREKYNIKQLLVTRSDKGMSLFSKDCTIHIPTHSEEVFDVSGAGDTVVAALSMTIAAGYDLKDAIHIANAAAGVVIKKTGTASLTIDELNKSLE